MAQKTNIGLIAGLGLAGLGLYYLSKKKDDVDDGDNGDIPGNGNGDIPGLHASVHFSENEPIENACRGCGKMKAWTIIENTGTVPHKFVYGFSWWDADGVLHDEPLKIRTTDLQPGSKVLWGKYLDAIPTNATPGIYGFLVAVWDVPPSGDCETQGTCHRLAEDYMEVEIL